MNDPNCLIIAGEKSGEEHCLSFFEDLRSKTAGVKYWGVGGDSLKNLGLELIYHINEFSSMGFSEVIGKIPFYFRALNHIEKEVERRNCKFAILIDFQDFNLRLAKRLSKKGVKVLYYVAPQAWAWKENRVNDLKRSVHTLFSILPFELEWFQNRGVERIKLVTHPVFGKYKGLVKVEKPELGQEINLLVLPGSRSFEIEKLLPVYSEAINQIRKKTRINVRTVISSNLTKYKEMFSSLNCEKIYQDSELEDALNWANLAIATSGTVTLTCGIFNVPTIVCYETSLFNEFVFYTFINYKNFISLTNLILEEEVFPELIQESATSYNIQQKVERLIEDKSYYDECVQKLSKLNEKLDCSDFDVSSYLSNVILEK